MKQIARPRTGWFVRRGAAICLTAALTTVLALPATADAETGTTGTPDLSDIGTLVDQLVPQMLKDGQVPGAAVSIVAGGQEIFSAGYGVTDAESNTPVDPATTGFYSASTAKLFTAAAVLQLVDQGKLDLDADVNDYLTTFTIDDTYPGHPVTLQQLLTHTAGFDPDYGSIGTSQVDGDGLTSLGDSLEESQPARIHPPGTVLSYDNYGVALAGYIVEEVSGVPYADYVNDHVYGALGMTGSTASQPHPAAVDATLAKGYRPDGDGFAETSGQYNPWAPSGPGQVITAGDMGKFMTDQYAAESKLGAGIPATMQKQQYSQDDRMPGLGFIYEERPYSGLDTLFKGGDTQGFHTDMVLLPAQKFGLFIAVNGDGNGDFDEGDLVDAVLDKYYATDEQVAAPQAIDGKDVARYAGTYQSSRVSHHSVMKARALTQSMVVVTANSDGTLTTSNRPLSTNADADTQDWVQIDTGLFHEVDGRGLIAIDDNGVLTESRSQNQVYLKLAWYENPNLHQIVAVVGIVGLLVGLIAFPIVALVRRLRRRPAYPTGARGTRLLAWVTAAVAVAVTVTVATLLADQDVAVELLTLGSPALIAVMILAGVTVLGSVGMCLGAVAAWWRGWWQLPGRLSYTLLALCAVAFSTILVAYNFVGPPFD